MSQSHRRRRVDAHCLARWSAVGVAVGSVVAVVLALVPLTVDTQSGHHPHQLECGSAVETIADRGPARRGGPTPAAESACRAAAELQLSVAGAAVAVPAVLLGGTCGYTAARRRRRKRRAAR